VGPRSPRPQYSRALVAALANQRVRRQALQLPWTALGPALRVVEVELSDALVVYAVIDGFGKLVDPVGLGNEPPPE
jgi:hypothetical protein